MRRIDTIDWTVVQQKHVKEACRLYDAGEVRPHHPAQNTFLLRDGKRYPAKFIRGLAYEIATGDRLNPSVDYSGGAETVEFFKKLGFSTEYKGNVIHGEQIQPINYVDMLIEEISIDLSKLQRSYREWAGRFESHEGVISWLWEKKINEREISRCQRQDSFKLLSSNWNPITIPTLYTRVPECMARMKKRFDKLFQNLSEARIDRIWYLLYFIHPVRHELYYFDVHYPEGYFSRLARLIRSHRQGLKGVKKYLNTEGRTIDDSYIRACSTTAFKHIHLHPTTSTWEKTNLQNIKEAILRLEIGEDCLSSDELDIAMTLSTMATKSFERWIGYAPCAINEGPIFTLKENKKHSDCFKEIIELLQGTDPNQNIIRAKLEEYYKIEA